MYDWNKLKSGDRIITRPVKGAAEIDGNTGAIFATVSNVYDNITYFRGDNGHYYGSSDCFHLSGEGRKERLGKDWELVHAPTHALAVEPETLGERINIFAEFKRAGDWLYRGYIVARRGIHWRIPGVDPVSNGESAKGFRTMWDAFQWAEENLPK